MKAPASDGSGRDRDGAYAAEVSLQESRWDAWLNDRENSPIVSAPNLTHFGQRQTLGAGIVELTRENLIEWIREPSTIKIGTRMQEHAAIYQPDDEEASLTEQQVAAVMGVRVGTVKSQTRHALGRLRLLVVPARPYQPTRAAPARCGQAAVRRAAARRRRGRS